MKLLLVNVLDQNRAIDKYLPNLGLGYLASFLRKRIPSIQIDIIDHDVSDFILRNKPNIVGISVCSPNFGKTYKIVKTCENMDIPVIMGGVHISVMPSLLPKGAALGIIGEGEQTFFEVIQMIYNGGLKVDNLRKIDGIVFHNEDGQIEFTRNRNLISLLDRLPFPARDLLEKNIPGINRENLHMFSSRGCPYRCVFCSSSRFWDKQRYFSPDYVIEELKYVIHTYSPQMISFWDDLFIAPFKRFEQIVELIIKNNINKKVKFALQCRANLVNKNVAVLLKKMNVFTVSMGLESGCQKTLDYLKGGITVEQNKRAIDLIADQGIRVTGGFIIGSPQETKEDIKETLNFIKKSKLFHFDIFLLTPYPGTPIWEYAEKRGIVSSKNMDWSQLRSLDMSTMFPENSFVLSEKLSIAELFNLFKLFEKVRQYRKFKSLSIEQKIKIICRLFLVRLRGFIGKKNFNHQESR